jgi:hypothetical protein
MFCMGVGGLIWKIYLLFHTAIAKRLLRGQNMISDLVFSRWHLSQTLLAYGGSIGMYGQTQNALDA